MEGALVRQCKELLQTENVSSLPSDPIMALQLCRLEKVLTLEPFHLNHLLAHAKVLESHVWECLHLTHWHEVDEGYHRVYGFVSWVLAMCHKINMDIPVRDIHSLIDKGILLGAPETVDILLSCLEGLHSPDGTGVTDTNWLEETKQLEFLLSNFSLPTTSYKFRDTVPRFSGTSKNSIPILYDNDLLTFYEKFFLTNRPVIIRGCIEHWNALSKWNDLEYIDRICGHRLVPVEVGKDYLCSDSSQKLMTIREFINQFILEAESSLLPHKKRKLHSVHVETPSTTANSNDNCENKIGYIAQHCLFDQIPELRGDISVPDQCSFLQPDEEVDQENGKSCSSVLINAWFGPVGTVSPLHHDPYHNLLAQVHGHKYIRLYHPDQSTLLHPMTGRMSNSSSIDLLSPRLEEDYPDIVRATYEDVVLEPGDMLFIPRWHWHFCSAVSQSLQDLSGIRQADRVGVDASDCYSFSVNFWWGKRLLKVDA